MLHLGIDSAGWAKGTASMRPFVVVVPNVLVKDAFQMASAPDHDPVQTLLSNGSHPPLRDRVGVGRLDRCLDDPDAVGLEDLVEGASELAVAVTE
jgi:hypothetical protein